MAKGGSSAAEGRKRFLLNPRTKTITNGNLNNRDKGDRQRMKRRSFIQAMLVGAAGAASPLGCAWNGKSAPAIATAATGLRVQPSWTETTLRIRGLKKPLSVMHITDSHISVLDDSEKQYHKLAERMDKAYVRQPHCLTGETTTAPEGLQSVLRIAEDADVDLLALTGDIVNNPSKSSVRFVSGELEECGIPYLYTSGNHDWCYEGMPGKPDDLRDEWIKEALMPLYADGVDPLNYAEQMGGINFVAIDNSTYQVTPSQLAFFQKEIARGLPTVLMLHIPLQVPRFEAGPAGSCGVPRTSGEPPLASSVEFVKVARASKNMVAALTGHHHAPLTFPLAPSGMQYVTPANCYGAYRIMRFEPMG